MPIFAQKNVAGRLFLVPIAITTAASAVKSELSSAVPIMIPTIALAASVPTLPQVVGTGKLTTKFAGTALDQKALVSALATPLIIPVPLVAIAAISPFPLALVIK
jgi:hypothetical protein